MHTGHAVGGDSGRSTLRTRSPCLRSLAVDVKRGGRGDFPHRVVGGQADGLVGGPVRQVGPVPGGDQHVLGLEVAVVDPRRVRRRQPLQKLVRHPQLRPGGLEASGVTCRQCHSRHVDPHVARTCDTHGPDFEAAGALAVGTKVCGAARSRKSQAPGPGTGAFTHTT